jgi:hypothetical protein
MMVGDNMTKISRKEEEGLVVPEFDAVEFVEVMKIAPTSSCGGTAAVVTMGEDCCCLGVHSISFIWKLPHRSEIAPKLQTLVLLLNFHLNIHVSASAPLVGFDSTSNAYLLHRWLVDRAKS